MGKYSELYLLAGIVSTIVVVVVGVVYAKYGRGVATKIFGLALPSVGFCAILGSIIGKLGLNMITGFVIIPIGTVVSVTSLYLLHRMVVSALTEQVQDLNAGRHAGKHRLER